MQNELVLAKYKLSFADKKKLFKYTTINSFKQ